MTSITSIILNPFASSTKPLNCSLASKKSRWLFCCSKGIKWFGGEQGRYRRRQVRQVIENNQNQEEEEKDKGIEQGEVNEEKEEFQSSKSQSSKFQILRKYHKKNEPVVPKIPVKQENEDDTNENSMNQEILNPIEFQQNNEEKELLISTCKRRLKRLSKYTNKIDINEDLSDLSIKQLEDYSSDLKTLLLEDCCKLEPEDQNLLVVHEEDKKIILKVEQEDPEFEDMEIIAPFRASYDQFGNKQWRMPEIPEWLREILRINMYNCKIRGQKFEMLPPPFAFKMTNIDFSKARIHLIFESILQTCVTKEIKSLGFKKCIFPVITEQNIKNKTIITPADSLRPLYGVSFEECKFNESQEYDKADQIGLLLNCEGLPSRSPSGDPQQVGGGISSITFKNNGFSEVEMAKLKVYLCYAENLMIYEEN
ncbi:unnamed protein product [Moneuplotes crassus]|uniref:Uncharacterized protein n=1 Tax=Euplotes crassus TaxID=5936 RepID=A0AAD1U682_EUPCR|nr:unnamed protein product [Moneuplotes crassus]